MSGRPRPPEKKCPHCPRRFVGRGLCGFGSHVEACRNRRTRQQELEAIPPIHIPKKRRIESDHDLSHVSIPNVTEVEPIESQIALEYAPLPVTSPIEEHVQDDGPSEIGPQLPEVYILLRPHEHAQECEHLHSEIIPLDASISSVQPEVPTNMKREGIAPNAHIHHPFATRADFEITEFSTKHGLSKDGVEELLQGINGTWANTTFRKHSDMKAALASARRYVVPFVDDSVDATLNGHTHTVNFSYRDPWSCSKNYATDSSLAPYISWYSYKKFYCEGELRIEMPLYDEFATGTTWESADNDLNIEQDHSDDALPHCFFPWEVWFDKGHVSKHVVLHPMLMRPRFLPSSIANGAGNGGSIYLGLIKNLPAKNPSTAQSQRSGSVQDHDYSRFKSEVYQKVLHRVFNSWMTRSHEGEGLECGDGQARVLHPGIPIKAMDAEEQAEACCTRHASAKHPCFQCLVEDKDLASFTTRPGKTRTESAMQAVYEQARMAPSATQAERILQSKGLHNLKPFTWGMRFSDTYAAAKYDKLHFPDSGVFGKHAWPVIVEDLKKAGPHVVAKYEQNTIEIPRWSGLKNLKEVTSRQYYDANVYMDISRTLPACIVKFYPKNSPVVHWSRSYQHVRMLHGVRCQSDNRLARLGVRNAQLEAHCTRFTAVTGKSFNFLKTHLFGHAPDDIRRTGSLITGDTRIDESIHQDLRCKWLRTNFKNIEHQINEQDMNEEIIARIRMYLDADDGERQKKGRPMPGSHWRFGSRVRKGAKTSYTYERTTKIKGFDTRLRGFLEANFPDDAPARSDIVKMDAFHTLYLYYQDVDDWREGCTILHATPLFHHQPRYDCALLDADTDEVPRKHWDVVRLQGMFTCRLRLGRSVDLALVRRFKPSKWKPKTVWDGLQISDENKDLEFMLMDRFLRGVRMNPAFGSPKNGSQYRTFYLDDCTDTDIYLRTQGLVY